MCYNIERLFVLRLNIVFNLIFKYFLYRGKYGNLFKSEQRKF